MSNRLAGRQSAVAMYRYTSYDGRAEYINSNKIHVAEGAISSN